ncbi:MAG: VOC family protein [Candidatus Saccharimonas sp.]
MKIEAAFSGISVDDIGKAKQFYTEVIGLPVKNEDMGLELKLPSGQSLFLYEKGDHQPATFTVLNFVVSDIDATVDELVGRGVVFERYDTMPAQQDEKGILRGLSVNQGPDIAWFKDPANNILSVLQSSK